MNHNLDIVQVLAHANLTEAKLKRLDDTVLNPSCEEVVQAIFAKIGECFDDIDKIVDANIKAVTPPGCYGAELDFYQRQLSPLEQKYGVWP